MAFNRNDPVDLQSLQDEVNIDPISMGYAALPSTDTKKLLRALNEAESNVEEPPPTSGAEFTHQILMETWEPKGALNESIPWIESLTREQGDISQYEAKYRANCGPNSLANLDAIIQLLSRAEVIYGQGTVITENDWFAARDFEG